MAWCRKSDKSLSEQMMAYSTDTYMHHLASVKYVHYLKYETPVIQGSIQIIKYLDTLKLSDACMHW